MRRLDNLKDIQLVECYFSTRKLSTNALGTNIAMRLARIARTLVPRLLGIAIGSDRVFDSVKLNTGIQFLVARAIGGEFPVGRVASDFVGLDAFGIYCLSPFACLDGSSNQ